MSIIFSERKLRRHLRRSLLGIICAVFLVYAITAVPIVTHAATVESHQTRPFIFDFFDEMMRQLSGVALFTAQAIDAVLYNDSKVDDTQTYLDPKGLPPYNNISKNVSGLPFLNTGKGTFIINAPVLATSQFTVEGDSSLATTTISGLLSAGPIAGDRVTISGGAQVRSLRVLTEAAISQLLVQDNAQIGSKLFVDGATNLTGPLEANGGITTNGADVDLGDGSLFASNIVNKIQAGTYIKISGTDSEPKISVTIDEGVTYLNGSRGSITLLGGTDISMSGLTIANNSTLSSVTGRGGCTDCLLDAFIVDGLTIASGTINATIIGSTTPAVAYFTEATIGATTSTTTLFTVQGSGTSSFGGGINLDSGCFSINNVCVASAASSTYIGLGDTPNTFVANAIQYVNGTTDALTQSANFVFDGTSLGVGTSSPTTRLTVDGSTLLAGVLTVDGNVLLQSQADVRWYDSDNSNYVGFQSPAGIGSNVVWTLPNTDGSVDDILVTDGSGTLRFAAVGAVGGGSEDYIGLTDTPSSFVNNAIPYATTSSLLFSSNFVFDGTNFGVGLGTPTVPLTVQGSVRFQSTGLKSGLVYDAAQNNIGIGADIPEERLTIQNGSVLQRGGTSTALYVPQIEGSLALASNPSANAIQVQDDYAYLVSGSLGNDFHIIDITDTSAPFEVGALGLPDTANDLFVQGDYAYIVSTFSGSDFHIIDISSPSAPVEVGSLDLPTSAYGVFVQGDYAYAVTGNVGTDFHVIDITDVTNPVQVGEMELPDSGTDVVVRGDYAYVTTEGSGDDFLVIDITNPTTPTTTDSLNLPASANEITLVGKYAYVVTLAPGDDFHIIDIDDPTAISITGSLNLNTSANTVDVVGGYAYVGTAGTGDDIHVVDITKPTDPVEVGSVDLASGGVTGVKVVGRYGYVSSESTGDEFFVIDVTGIESQSAQVHSLSVGALTVTGNARFAENLSVGNGLLVGAEGIQNAGALIVRSTKNSYFTGSLGIGTTTPGKELTVSGSIQSTDLLGGSTNLTTDVQGNIIRDPSDVRLKENIVPLENGLESVMQLRGVRYQWKDKERFGSQKEIGFIAQEVDPILPEVVRKGGKYWSINTRNILAVVVEAIKEIWIQLQGTQKDVNQLQQQVGELEQLRKRVQDLESQLTDINTDINTEANTDTNDGGVDTSTSSDTVRQGDLPEGTDNSVDEDDSLDTLETEPTIPSEESQAQNSTTQESASEPDVTLSVPEENLDISGTSSSNGVDVAPESIDTIEAVPGAEEVIVETVIEEDVPEVISQQNSGSAEPVSL